MLTAPAVPEEEISSWPIEESGLPARVVHSTRIAGLSALGDLRAWQDSDLLNLHALGKKSLGQIHEYFGMCDRLAEGRLAFTHLIDLLHAFLDDDEFTVLSFRYGFDLAAPLPSGSSMTLQAIGNRMHRTRERIRQIEETAMRRLESRLCRCSLVPWHDYFTGMLETADGCMACGDLFEHTRRSLFDYSNPCALLLLLCGLSGARITYRNGFFSLWSAEDLDRVPPEILAWLRQHDGRGRLAEICEHLEKAGLGSRDSIRKHAQLMAEHCADIVVAADGRIYSADGGISHFLADVLKKFKGPVNYRVIAREANELLRPASRRGAGFWLKALRSHPGIRMRESGRYELSRRASGS